MLIAPSTGISDASCRIPSRNLKSLAMHLLWEMSIGDVRSESGPADQAASMGYIAVKYHWERWIVELESLSKPCKPLIANGRCTIKTSWKA